MYKQFQEDRYLYWSVMSAILQVRVSNRTARFNEVYFVCLQG